jgi:thiol-disulfide isomerase/thioredoxin
VKALSAWNAAKMKKHWFGTAVPELTVTDVHGKTVTLSALKGKTVLLDFWTTRCPSCRADGPALDKLYKRYGPNDLMIVGFSVSEDRGVLEKLLLEHPHSVPLFPSSCLVNRIRGAVPKPAVLIVRCRRPGSQIFENWIT